MKNVRMKVFLFFLFSLISQGLVTAQLTVDSINIPFGRGEKLVYNVYFKSFLTGKMNAGEITIEIKNTKRSFYGQDTYQIECIGKSKGAFNLFMKVEDKFESFIDEKSMMPFLFTRKTREGHYKKDDEVEFFHEKNLAISRQKVNKTPFIIYDILSAYYFTRTTNFTKMKLGEDFSLPIFFDDSVFTSKIVCYNREVVQTKLGNFNCVSFRPMVITGSVFSDRYPMTVWFTDDENKIPVLISAAIAVGRVEIELVESSGLVNPFLSLMEPDK